MELKGIEETEQNSLDREQNSLDMEQNGLDTEPHSLDQEAWELAGQLVAIDSSDPGAYEGRIEKWIANWLKEKISQYGGNLAQKIELREKEVLPGRFNLMARIPGKTDEPGLTYICHMDTVMLGDGWDEAAPALGAVVKDGKLYGRGACDMKSGLACALTVFGQMVRLAGERGELPERTFTFIGTVDEEDFMRGVEAAIRDGWVGKDDWILDTEPTDGQIQVAHKGRTWFELTMDGITAHASNPWKGADAIAAMAEAVSHIRKAIKGCPSHEDLGVSTVTFGQITGGYRPYVVPDSCKVWIDMRLVPPTDTEAARKIVEQAIEEAQREIPGVKGHYTITGDRPYVEKDSISPLLLHLKEACDAVTGKDTVVGSFNGYTDTAVIAGILGNHNCMSYGPGSLELAHKPNEYVPYEDVCRCRRVLERLAEVIFTSGSDRGVNPPDGESCTKSEGEQRDAYEAGRSGDRSCV